MSADDIRRQARRDIHAQFAVPASYTDSNHVSPVPLTVRWHGQNVHPIGDFDGQAYAELLTRIDRVIFLRDELITAGLTPAKGGVITIPTYGDAAFNLTVQEPVDGPITLTWNVTPRQVVAPS